MAKLTKIEQRAFDALLKAPGRSLGIIPLIEEVYGRWVPGSSRAGMAAIMRSVIAKTEGGPIRAVRTSDLGRGSKAVYELQNVAE